MRGLRIGLLKGVGAFEVGLGLWLLLGLLALLPSLTVTVVVLVSFGLELYLLRRTRRRLDRRTASEPVAAAADRRPGT